MLLLMPLFSTGCDSNDEPTANDMISSIKTRLYADAEWIGESHRRGEHHYISILSLEKSKKCKPLRDAKSVFECPVTIHFTRSEEHGSWSKHDSVINLKMTNQAGKWFCDRAVVASLHALSLNKQRH